MIPRCPYRFHPGIENEDCIMEECAAYEPSEYPDKYWCKAFQTRHNKINELK